LKGKRVIRRAKAAFLRVAGPVAALAAMFAAMPAHAAAGGWFTTDHGQVRLVAASSATGQDAALHLGLQFRMRDNWKIYWRSPGDAGFPPQPDWSGSTNLKDATVEWPLPERFSVLGLTTLGYKHEVVLPVTATLREPGKPLEVKARVNYLTCDDICVPYQATLALDLPAGAASSTPEAGLIARFAAKVPPRTGEQMLKLEGAWLDRAGDAPILRIAARTDGQFVRPDLLVEGPPGFRFAPRRTELSQAGAMAVMHIAVSPPPALKNRPPPAPLTGQAVTLTLIDKGEAVERHFTVAPGEARSPPPAMTGPLSGPFAAPPETGWREMLTILGLALLGGLILNLMPCVLPVLSLKLLSVIGHGGSEAGHVRVGFLASAAGIVTSFLALATLAVGLKAAGMAVGWGIQFQQPVFIAVMAAIVALFAANLFCLFEVALPGAVADIAYRAGEGNHIGAHFATGAFATLLATPCTAPFLGTAIGFALSRGAMEIYAVFAALGIGLALPYLLVAAVPKLATGLPRPGAWMVTLRRLLALALAGTAVWLLTVLHAQSGLNAAVAAGVALAAMVAVLALRHRLPGRAAWGLAAVFAIAAIALPPLVQRDIAPARQDASAPRKGGLIAWRPFAPDAIAGHVAAGRVVFVDITAEWCLTCQVNKAVALETRNVARMMNGVGIVAMQGDWTRPDPAIQAFLKRFGRYGIPFNVVFGPGFPAGKPLSELLSEREVLAALAEAGGRPAFAGRGR
jgi:suppressor for copper-sensitivity B